MICSREYILTYPFSFRHPEHYVWSRLPFDASLTRLDLHNDLCARSLSTLGELDALLQTETGILSQAVFASEGALLFEKLDALCAHMQNVCIYWSK